MSQGRLRRLLGNYLAITLEPSDKPNYLRKHARPIRLLSGYAITSPKSFKIVILEMQDIADILASLSPAAREVALNGPAHAPPEGVMPSFDNPQNQNRLVIGVINTGLALVTILFFARVYARVFCLKRVHIEDGMMIQTSLT